MESSCLRVYHSCGHWGVYEVSGAVSVEAMEAALANVLCLSCQTKKKLEGTSAATVFECGAGGPNIQGEDNASGGASPERPNQPEDRTGVSERRVVGSGKRRGSDS